MPAKSTDFLVSTTKVKTELARRQLLRIMSMAAAVVILGGVCFTFFDVKMSGLSAIYETPLLKS